MPTEYRREDRPHLQGRWSDTARTCIDCGSPFALAEGEIEFYAMRGLELPRRCASCRKDRRRAGAPRSH